MRVFFAVIGILLSFALGFGVSSDFRNMKEFREARPPAMEQSVENKADQAFLEHIRRPLAPLDALPNPYVSLESLKSAVEKDFEQNKALVLQRYPDLTGRQALVFYLQARVHGSFSTYFVRGCMPADVTQQLYSAIGNCSDYAVRLMLLADLFGIETARVSFFTPSLPGHMLVEAFDPQENTAYLLDPTFNLLLMMRSPPTRGGVLTQLLTMTAQERVRLLSGNTTGFLYQLPFRFYYANPGLGHFSGRSLSVPGIMIDPGALVGMWKKAFGEELEETLAFSKKANRAHSPLTLAAMRGIGAVDRRYEPRTRVEFEALWKIYGLDADDQSPPAAPRPDGQGTPQKQQRETVASVSVECGN